jgi:phosphodiesterase/alkaline phosphatase D-like protein
VWVAEEGESGPVAKYDDATENKQVEKLPPPPFEHSPGLAVDSAENFYLLRGTPDVAKFDREGSLLVNQLTSCECATALAVDTSTNDLLVDEGLSAFRSSNTIARYESTVEGSTPTEILEGISSSRGLAVNSTNHVLYVSQTETGTIARFDLVPLPEVTTGPASEVMRTSAKLEGEVNPEGEEVTSCVFEYGPTTAYGQTAPCTPAPGHGSGAVHVSAAVPGLTAQSTYHYRLSAGNAHGVRHGSPQEFSTPVAVEGVNTGEASEVQGTTATLNGSLEPNGTDAHYFFEYGTSESYGQSTTPVDAGAGPGTASASASLEGLEPNDTYHYRLVGENTYGKTDGGENTFTTAEIPPRVLGTPSASFVSSQSAVLNGSLNPEHASFGAYHFEYGPCPTLTGCPTLERTTPEASSIYGVIGATQEVSGLAPATTYRYRLVASNKHVVGCPGGRLKFEGGHLVCVGGTPEYAGSESSTEEQSFTTGPATTVAAATGPPAAVTSTSAVISGAVNPDGQPATYSFELGVYAGAGTTYGIVLSGPVAGETSTVAESEQLTGLQPGTTYAYRIVIRSGYGEATGAPATFTTQGLPAVLGSPSTPPLLATPSIAFPTGSLANTGNQPAIKVLHYSVRGNSATIAVSVPSAGKLVAEGVDLSKGEGKVGKAGTIKVTLSLTRAGKGLLSKHPGRKLQTKVHLTFTPSKGSKLTTTTTVLVG